MHSFPANFRHEKCGCAGKGGRGQSVFCRNFFFFKRNSQIFIAMASNAENIVLLIEKKKKKVRLLRLVLAD